MLLCALDTRQHCRLLIESQVQSSLIATSRRPIERLSRLKPIRFTRIDCASQP